MSLSELGSRAKEAAQTLRTKDDIEKKQALIQIAAALTDNAEEILLQNQKDIETARDKLSASMLDRLTLTKERIRSMAEAVSAVAQWPDPVGKILEETKRPNGLIIQKTAVPLGVIGIIFEARPNVTSDCAALCIKAGNACILRGGKEAFHSNMAIVRVMREALTRSSLDVNCIQLVEDTRRESAEEMMKMTGYLDVLIPRGGAGLIKSVVDNAKVPVIETGVGNCHIYIDKAADPDMAADIVFNAKTSRPSVCNAAEKVLVHRDVASTVLPLLAKRLAEKEVQLRGDAEACSILPGAKPAAEEEWSQEYLDYVLGIKVVGSIDEAIRHIEQYSTHHSEAIVTEDPQAADKFLRSVDSAAFYRRRRNGTGRGNRHIHPEASRQRPYGSGSADLIQICNQRQRTDSIKFRTKPTRRSYE